MATIVSDLDLDRDLSTAGDSWEDWDDSQDFPWTLGPESIEPAETAPEPIDPTDREWWASQNIAWHATDLVTPETDGVTEWATRLAEAHDALLADADLPEWAITG